MDYYTFEPRIPRSQSVANEKMTDDDNGVQYRRMSLKDFTGLESHAPQSKISVTSVTLKEYSGLEDYHAQSLSSILEDMPMPRQSPVPIPGTPATSSVNYTGIMENGPPATVPVAPSTSLIDSYSIRRRSMIGSTESDIADPAQKQDAAPSDTLFEDLSASEINDRLHAMRVRLAATIRNLPNQSPQKKMDSGADKAKLLEATRNLNSACKAMVQAVCEGQPDKKAEVINEVIESADKITSVTEKVIVKSDSIFEAELASAKTDQMLKSLEDTISCLDKAMEHAGDITSDPVNQLLVKNTALTANISQLLDSFRRRPS